MSRQIQRVDNPTETQKAARRSLSDTPDEPPNPLLDALDWVIRLIARLIVLGLGSAVLVFGWALCTDTGEAPSPGLASVEKLAEHWPALALLMIPLFYLPARRLIYRARAFGNQPEVPEQQIGNAPLPGKGTQIDAGTQS